jgi:3D (Asp-Asp-Asp) domain-containing protein/peptidoglycan hydrolase CwlO-like protein
VRTLVSAVVAGTAAFATLATGVSAENAADLQRQAQELRQQNQALAGSSQSAVTSLASIEARLAQARAELASFRARAAQVGQRRRAVYRELTIARSAQRATNRALARRLQMLYEQGDTDAIAVILGAGSLDAALDAIETVDLAADQDHQLLAKIKASSRRLAALNARLAGRQRELDQLAAARAAATASLDAARASKLATIGAIRGRTRANSSAIAGLEDRARTLAAVQAAPPVAAPVPGAPRIVPGPASEGVYSLTVVATAYALRGNTSSGMHVGWGAVAVDPSLIPLGSRLSIPGYGLGVAADTGGAIQGARIDLWFPTVAQARAWGSRTVTITVYSN